MLVEFSVGNYLSFKDIVTLSLVSSSIKEHNESNVFKTYSLPLLKSAVIYGANASGKTNLLTAFAFMKDLVPKSAVESQTNEEIRLTPYKLSTETSD
ncbi:AAA family ATPase, partial [Clostridioides difficile]